MLDSERQDPVLSRYLEAEYVRHNPSWDQEDSPWKAELVRRVLEIGGVRARTIAEVGCGAGGVLAELAPKMPSVSFHGYDIAPAAVDFWAAHANPRIEFTLGDFLSLDDRHYDVVLLLDVIEHIADPFDFLSRVRSRGDYFVFHFPLDLSAVSVLREKPLLRVREKVGHIHYFTKGLAIALLRECGFEVVISHFTGAALNAPQRGLRTRLASLPRRTVSFISRDLSARLFGGETLIALARPSRDK